MNDRPAPHIWTDELVQKLLTMRRDGFSASLIAREFGISRNAVIGKMHRVKNRNSLGIEYVTGNSMQKIKLPPRSFVKPPKPVGAVGNPVPFIRTGSQHCRFIVSDDGDPAMVCGNQKLNGSSYCEGHHAACYNGKPQAKLPRLAEVVK